MDLLSFLKEVPDHPFTYSYFLKILAIDGYAYCAYPGKVSLKVIRCESCLRLLMELQSCYQSHVIVVDV